MEHHDANLLADAFEGAYGMTRFYTSKLKEADPFKEWEVNGHKLNSLAWLTAHLCWAEDTLLLKATGGERFECKWLKHYNIGSDGSIHDPNITFKELLDTRKAIHEKTMNHLRTLTNEDLDKENAFGFEFFGSKTIRSIIHHAIRHEGWAGGGDSQPQVLEAAVAGPGSQPGDAPAAAVHLGRVCAAPEQGVIGR